MLTIYALTWAGVIAAQASPGPNLAAVASVATAQGRRHAFSVVLGLTAGTLVWSLATALGLGALFDTVPVSLLLLKVAGGCYLLYLGIRAARAALRGGKGSIAPETHALTHRAATHRGALVMLTNPQAALMWAAIDTFLFGHGLGASHVLLFAPLAAFSTIVVYGVYAWLFSTGLAMQGYARFARWFEGLFAIAFCVMGADFLWSVVQG